VVDYSPIDQSPMIGYVLFPTRWHTTPPANAFDIAIPVDDGVQITCRFHKTEDRWPWVLYFHGNGEVVGDYDDTATFYSAIGLNLVVADYRGYGASTGTPTLNGLTRDAHTIFKAVRTELTAKNLDAKLWIMGRSLGSISGLELAYHYPGDIKGLILESGFVCIVRVMEHLGVPTSGTSLEEIDAACVGIAQGVTVPTLIIHGDQDTIVPIVEAYNLERYIPAARKEMVIIGGADHNTIMFAGFDEYFDAIRRFVEEGS
jgi:pimeloyl-ACP methyl ester carboxylesterase